MKRIGIFYVNAGGGHSSAAKAIVAEIEKKYSDKVECVLVDAMNQQPTFAVWVLEKGYTYAINYIIWFWWFVYWISQFRFVIKLEDKFFSRSVRNKLLPVLVKEKFDHVISLYFFLNRSIVQIINDNQLNTKVSCVVTDPFTVPNTWFLEDSINYYVYSEEASAAARKFGISKNKINIIPPIINERFYNVADITKNDSRNKLGWPIDKKIILVMSGGTGLYHGPQALWQLVKTDSDKKIVVVCGQDKLFFHHAKWLAEKYPDKFLSVYGFADNVPEILNAVDIVISKAGPATIFEALLLKKPIILLYYLWKQELGNRDFVVKHAIGKYTTRLRSLNKAVDELLNSTIISENLDKVWPLVGAESGAEKLLENILKTP